MATRIIEMVEAEPRRRFSDDDKARIVSEAMMPGASVLDVARRHRVCTSLVYRWRRMLLRDGVASEALPGAAFVPVEVAGVPMVPHPEPLGPGAVEVVGPAGQRIRLAPPIDARVLKAVLAGFA
ncbi:IS66-like element accessory protein TnpA [Sphingomonas sp. VNH70]|uniref:IS66-like element accessory protein TnpA n=1 Tax=Sphingomonas silueang TaxID=3156617 RepID=UPI0032B55A9C